MTTAEKTDGMRFTIDQEAVGVIIDGSRRAPLATGFVFLRSDWVVTAQHVVETRPRAREWRPGLRFQSKSGAPLAVRVHAACPDTDVCVLQLEAPSTCTRPLLPGNETLSTSKGVVYAGYSPTRSTAENGVILFEHAREVDVEERERSLTERVLTFDGSEMEGGLSGGPVFGDGGSVVGVLMERVTTQAGAFKGRATSIEGLLRALKMEFDGSWLIPQAETFPRL
jgi:S1-C subfamily serine protease